MRLICEPDQRAALNAVAAAWESGSPFAVLDATWPAERRRAAEALVTGRYAGTGAAGEFVVFSSGSCGAPRGIRRTYASWDASVSAFSQLIGLSGDVSPGPVWVPGPLASSLFLFGAYHAHRVGARVVLAGQDPRDAEAVHTTPAQLPEVVRRVRAAELPRLRTVVVAGDRVPGRRRAEAVGLGLNVVEYCGAAELSFCGFRTGSGPLRPFPGVDLEVRDGRLWSRSAYHAVGYLDDARGGPLCRDGHGWATVGDLAREVPGGVEVLGRGDAAVTVGAHTVVVEDVEEVLRGVPGIRDAAVVGVPHRLLGQQVAAMVTGDVTVPQVRRLVREQSGLPAAARPRRWVIVERIPQTEAGKVDRLAVADAFATVPAPVGR